MSGHVAPREYLPFFAYLPDVRVDVRTDTEPTQLPAQLRGMSLDPALEIVEGNARCASNVDDRQLA